MEKNVSSVAEQDKTAEVKKNPKLIELARPYKFDDKEYTEIDLSGLDDLTIKELIQLISEYPNLLRRPIILDNKRMQIGFNEDEIRAFLPRDYRKQELRQATIRAEIEGNND